MRSKPFESVRIERGFVPGLYTGVKGWARYHRKVVAETKKVRNPERYLHSSRKAKPSQSSTIDLCADWNRGADHAAV